MGSIITEENLYSVLVMAKSQEGMHYNSHELYLVLHTLAVVHHIIIKSWPWAA